MPVHPATKDGKPGYQYGESGRVYTYTPGDEESRKRAKERAAIQGYAIQKSQERRGERAD